MSNKIVLAFSGGLDTSYCVLDLKAQGYDVHTVFVYVYIHAQHSAVDQLLKHTFD